MSDRAREIELARLRAGMKKPEATAGHKIGAMIDGAAQGLAFGFSDEIAAGLDSGFGLIGSYDESLASERKRMAENQRLAGGYRMAGEVPGMVAGAVGMAAPKAAASVATKIAPTAMQAMTKLPQLAQTGLKGPNSI